MPRLASTIVALALLAPSTSSAQCRRGQVNVRPRARPVVAVWAQGYGPLLPSEWREQVLPAARRSLRRANPRWRILSARQTERFERQADEMDGRCATGAAVEHMVALRHRNGTAFGLAAGCDDTTCRVMGWGRGLETTAFWELPRSLRVEDWVAALSQPPSGERYGMGRGAGGSGFAVRETLGAWTEDAASDARSRLSSLAWPGACSHWRPFLLVDLIVEVRADGSIGEVGAWLATDQARSVLRCLERELPGALGDARFTPSEDGPRRLRAIGIWRRPD